MEHHHLTGWDTWTYRDRDGITMWKLLHHWPYQLMDGCWRLQHHFPFPKREEGTHSETPNAICLMKLSVSVKILRFKVWRLLHRKWSCYCRFLLRYGNYPRAKLTVFLALSISLIGRMEGGQNRLSLTEFSWRYFDNIRTLFSHLQLCGNHWLSYSRDQRLEDSTTMHRMSSKIHVRQ